MAENKNIESNEEQKNIADESISSAAESIPEVVQPSTLNPQPSTIQEMEVHHHTHASHGKKNWKSHFWEFIMLFLAVFCGFLAEYQLEHKIERDRARQFLQSMLIDVRTNVISLDSVMAQNYTIIANHDSLVNWLLEDSTTIDRGAFAKKMGPVWIRNFLVRRETYEQMKSSGSLRFIGNIEFLKKMMSYERITNFAQYRNQDFEKKYYTDLFIPTIYKSYDLTCQLYLDSGNYSDQSRMQKIITHQDILTGNDAVVFRNTMGAALTLRLERLKRAISAYTDARSICVEMEKLILKQPGIKPTED